MTHLKFLTQSCGKVSRLADFWPHDEHDIPAIVGVNLFQYIAFPPCVCLPPKAAAQLGSPAGRLGTRPASAVLGGMVPGGGGTRRRIAGRRRWSSWIFIRAANLCGIWAGRSMGKRNRPWRRGGPAPAPSVPWPGTTRSVPDRATPETTRRSWPDDPAGTELLCPPGGADELPGNGPTWLAHQFRGGQSACRQKQCRFKRGGQFWSKAGRRHLCALDEARRNRSGDELWSLNQGRWRDAPPLTTRG